MRNTMTGGETMEKKEKYFYLACLMTPFSHFSEQEVHFHFVLSPPK